MELMWSNTWLSKLFKLPFNLLEQLKINFENSSLWIKNLNNKKEHIVMSLWVSNFLHYFKQNFCLHISLRRKDLSLQEWVLRLNYAALPLMVICSNLTLRFCGRNQPNADIKIESKDYPRENLKFKRNRLYRGVLSGLQCAASRLGSAYQLFCLGRLSKSLNCFA